VKLSVLVPAHNEAATLEAAIKRLLDVSFPCELEVLVVDDGSDDATPELLRGISDPRLRTYRHERNRGKGAAVTTALHEATGDYAVMYDSDLEYSADDLLRLLVPLMAGESEVVFGTRTFGSHTAYSFWYVLGNKVVTMTANVLFNTWISDLETCYKLMPLSLFRDLQIQSKGFGMEAEITGKLLQRGIRPYEVPISYRARSRAAGKQLTWLDGLKAIAILLRIRIGSDRRARS
jgi:glycosyltransferase involved in cell wall biosynthesis